MPRTGLFDKATPQMGEQNGRADPRQAAPGKAAPGQAAPGRAAPGQAAPGRAAPGQAAPAPGHASKRRRAIERKLKEMTEDARKTQEELNVVTERQGELQRQVKKLQKQIAAEEKNAKDKEEKLKELQDELRACDAEIARLDSETKALEDKLDENARLQRAKGMEIEGIRAKLSGLDDPAKDGATLVQLEKQLATITDDVERLRIAGDQLEADKKELKEVIRSSRRGILHERMQIKKLERQTELAKRKLARLHNRRQQLVARLERDRRAATATRAQLEQAKNTLEQKKKGFFGFFRRAFGTIGAHEEKVRGLETRFSAAEVTSRETEQQLENLESQIDDAELAVGSLEVDIESHNAELALQEKELVEQEEMYVQAEERIKQNEAAFSAKYQRQQLLEGQLIPREQEIIRAEREKLNRWMLEAEETSRVLEAENDTLASSLKKAETSLEEERTKQDTLVDAIEDSKGKIAEAEQKLQELGQDRAREELELEAVRTHREKLNEASRIINADIRTAGLELRDAINLEKVEEEQARAAREREETRAKTEEHVNPVYEDATAEDYHRDVQFTENRSTASRNRNNHANSYY